MSSKHLWATALDDNSSSAKEQLGAVRREWSTTDAAFKTYKYVQNSTVTTIANGTALSFRDTIGQQVTGDISTGKPGLPAGVGIGAVTASYFGWIQCGGYHSAVATNGDDDISKGDIIVLDASTDGTVNSVAAASAATYKPVGVAVTDDVNADDTVATLLDCTYGGIIQ